MRENEDVAICADCLDPKSSTPSSANADFIAYAREDIPALLAEVERLQAENARAWAEVFKLRKQIEGDLQPWER